MTCGPIAYYTDVERNLIVAYPFPPNVERLVKEHMGSGNYTSEDELLLEALESLRTEAEECAAIQEGINSLERGDPGLALDEAFDAVRARHKLPPAG